jgi:hypothetical protein
MRRAGWIAVAIVGWSVCGTTRVLAQAPTPEGWVVLSIDEYQALRDRSRAVGPPAPSLPVDGTLSWVEYDLHVEGEMITGRGLLTVDVLRDGWARIPIPAGLIVSDARVDGTPAALVEGAPPYVLLSRTGRTVVSLDLVVPLAATAGTESISLPASPASVTKTTLLLPRSNVDLSLTGGLITDHTESNNESRWIVYGRPNEPLKLSWKHRVDDRRSALPLRARARITEVAGFSEDLCQVSASVHMEVVEGATQDITLSLPQGLVVNEVNGSTVGDWQTTGGTLRVHLLEPVVSETAFVVEGEMRVPREGRMAVPVIRMPGAERETGGVAVDVVGAGEIVERQATGFEPADPAELGDFVAGHESPSMTAFRHRPMSGSDPRALSVTVIRYTPQAVLVANVQEARYRVLAADDRVLVEARYAIRNNQRSFLKITLPANSTVWSAVVDGQPIRPGVSEDNSILLPIGKGRTTEEAPTSDVTLVYRKRTETAARRDRERLVVDLPAVDLPVSRTGVRFYFPPRFQVTYEPGSFRVEGDTGPLADAFQTIPVVRNAAKPILDSQSAGPAPGLQGLVDRFRSQGGERRITGALPVAVDFPEFGPSIFLVSELTAEGQAPSLAFQLKRARK